MILAKPTLDLQALDAPAEANLKGGLSVATGSVRVPSGGRVIVISVHAPVMKARAEDLAGRDLESVRLPHYPTASLRDVAYVISRDLARGRRFLAAGDWNTSPQRWDEFHATHEADFFQRAADDGWVDCFRRFHAEEGRTWFRGEDRPYQQDHAFCDPATASILESCDIDAHPAEVLKLSDHAPLVIEFTP